MDDLRALVAKLRRPYQDPLVREITTAAADALDRLAAVERDAERYRWLRDDARVEGGPIWAVTWRHGWPEDPRGDTEDLFSQALDAAIDAAIAARKGEG